MPTLPDRLAALVQSLTPTLAVLVLAVTATAHAGVRYWVRRRAHRDLADVGDGRAAHLASWITRGLGAILPPLVALIWIQGLYVIAALLVRQLPDSEVARAARDTLGWVYRAAVLAASIWLFDRAARILEGVLAARSRDAPLAWDASMQLLAGRLVRRGLPLLAVVLGAPALAMTPDAEDLLRRLTTLTFIGFVAWALNATTDAAATFVLRTYRVDARDNLHARAVHTQVVILRKVVRTVIAIFMLASMLMVFDSARRLGASLLASAGVAGIVVGFAAQKSLATLLAGFQIALTQPIRIDDAVVVEGEAGTIEEITLTYVVVRIWDLRRLVLPVSYFLEHPFQNWTRASTDLLGAVTFYVDYGAPIDALREELTRILRASPHWDGKVNALQVTDAREHTLEVRALASAVDASAAWELRCEIREKLVDFLQHHHPEALPHVRTAVSPWDDEAARTGAAAVAGNSLPAAR